MSADEFDIIRRHFVRSHPGRDDIVTGIGDDAAVLRMSPGYELVVCTDTLVAGRHFPPDTRPAAIGHRALAVNLSDIAAMAAEPAWATLALTLPEYDESWLDAFMGAFSRLADSCNVALVGGDTTRGPLSVTVQLMGLAQQGRALLRHGAQPGDLVYVTGTLGDAGLALCLQGGAGAALQQRLDFPEPRLEAGRRLRDLASAAIDISDGLLADLGHLLEADSLGARLQIDELPRSREFLGRLQRAGSEADVLFYELPLAAGDDYELCFTVNPAAAQEVMAEPGGLACGCTCIGSIEQEPGIRCIKRDGSLYTPESSGYLHFGD